MKDEEYLDLMVTELKKIRPNPRPVSKEQCASTKAIMDRDPKLDAIHSKRLVNPFAAYADKFYIRDIPPDDVALQEDIRRKSKNTLGQSEKSATSPEKREAAIHAFTYSRPADLTQQQKEKLIEINKITEYTSLPPEIKKLSFFKKLLNKLTKPNNNLSYAERREMIDQNSKEKK